MTVLQQSARIILLCCVGRIQSPAAKHMYFLNFNGISTSVTRPFLFARKALKIEVRNKMLTNGPSLQTRCGGLYASLSLSWTGKRNCYEMLVSQDKDRERSLINYHHGQKIV